jgi:hypothetical protein
MTCHFRQELRQWVAQDANLQDRLASVGGERSLAEAIAAEAIACRIALPSKENILNALRDDGPSGPPWAEEPFDPARFARWVPSRVTGAGEAAQVDWCFVGAQPFREPFFENTLQRCRAYPLARLLHFQTSVSVLDAFANYPGLPPAGFVFHLSRCGSTLITQLLAALSRSVVLSEPAALEDMLREFYHAPTLTEDAQIRRLHGLVHALGTRRSPAQQNLFIKFDCWHLAALPLIRRAFPDVPCVFAYRDPLEVLVSHGRQPGRQMVPSLVDPGRLGLAYPPASVEGLAQYQVCVLGRLCEIAVARFGANEGHLINYTELPEAIWSRMPAWFGLTLNTDDIARMRETAQFHAKAPYEKFAADSADKQRQATACQRQLAAEYAQPDYDILEARRVQARMHEGGSE